jgi:hypothetical protein
MNENRVPFMIFGKRIGAHVKEILHRTIEIRDRPRELGGHRPHELPSLKLGACALADECSN